MKKLLTFSIIIFCITIASNSKSNETDCSSINSKSYEIIDTGVGIKYCFNAGKFLIINNESKNQVYTYNISKFKKSYLHSFGKVKTETIKKIEQEFAKFSPHVIHFTDEGTLHTNLIYNNYHKENVDNTRVMVKESPYDTNQVITSLSNNINTYCKGERERLYKKKYIMLECEIVNPKNKKIIITKTNSKYNEEYIQKSKSFIQSRLPNFKISNIKANITQYNVYYLFKNKNYLLDIISTCNEYLPKRSCEDEKLQLKNLINNLIF